MVKKTYFGPDLDPLNPNLGCHFFPKICLCQSLDIMVRYQHVKCQKKNKDPTFIKFSEGRTDAQTD